MNIFYLSDDPEECAQFHCDKHVVKMILETAQLLSTAHHLHPSRADTDLLYKKTHVNHPCAIWTRQSVEHYRWLYKMWLSLLGEYTYRYDKVHASSRMVSALNNIPNLPLAGWKDPPQAMPDEFKNESTVQAYRDYYRIGKAHILAYKRRRPPLFLKGE